MTAARFLLRALAIAIAIASAIDPATARSGLGRARVAVVITGAATSAADRARSDVVRALGAGIDVVPEVTSDAAAAILIGDEFPREPLPDSMPVATISMAAAPGPAVRIVRVRAPARVPPLTAIRFDVDLLGRGVAGTSTEVTVRVAGVEVGRVSHRWTASPERWTAMVDAVPVGEPPFVCRVAIQSPGGTAATEADAYDVVVQRRDEALRVQFYDARPSWASTFVRRALERDARFAVESLDVMSRGITARTPDSARLTDDRLMAFDVVVVGGIDALTGADLRALGAFMRSRGGAVVMLPDEKVQTRSVADWIDVRSAERLLEKAAPLSAAAGAPMMSASELLVAATLPASATPIVNAAGGGAVIVSVPHGAGQLVVSGALDAWRFRANDDAAFDRFWRTTIAALALQAAPPLSVTLEPPVARPGDVVDVVVRARRHDASASASVDGRTLRLVPDAEAGVFRARVAAEPGRERSRIEARAGEDHATTTLAVNARARSIRPGLVPPLSLASTSHGGIDVPPARAADAARYVTQKIRAPREIRTVRPMRSPWWLLPFVASLALEWWLRRRAGLA